MTTQELLGEYFPVAKPYMDEAFRKAEEDRLNAHLLCSCGSGEYKEKNYDGYGIFLCYTCPSCYEERMGGYRSDIMERYECDEQIEEDY